ncbi:hypothetical protein FRAAL4419 [Frankia alni ACN14a]|uniref:Uncharacterized protein n=1 Tax=Frankia alni (strain DSM 45986 / CECT 9034 / ACN14a) TaxID=326424 RepID=Q0RHG7_FRAAA|nr:hypothetical protein FRAAL4419 [Frankia alni ACN14a]
MRAARRRRRGEDDVCAERGVTPSGSGPRHECRDVMMDALRFVARPSAVAVPGSEECADRRVHLEPTVKW